MEEATAAAWQEADGTTFHVRTLNYMRTKVKGPSGPCIYRCLQAWEEGRWKEEAD